MAHEDQISRLAAWETRVALERLGYDLGRELPGAQLVAAGHGSLPAWQPDPPGTRIGLPRLTGAIWRLLRQVLP